MTHDINPPSPAEGPADHGLSGHNRTLDLTTAQAMRVMTACTRPFADADTADDMLLELHNALVTDTDCQKMIFTHAHTLNALYHRLLSRALENHRLDGKPTLQVHDRMASLALQAQKQCLQSVTALATLRMIEKNAERTEGGKE